jgi:hypothetical protein
MDPPPGKCRKDESHNVFAGEDLSCPDGEQVHQPDAGFWNINDKALTH